MRVLLVASLSVCLPLMMCSTNRAEEVRFGQHIQPIFAEHCLSCHGPDKEQREADLRLDLEASAKESSIHTGRPEESELFLRITSDDPDLRMPPGKKSALTEQEIRLIRDWIEAGAEYQGHWSFEPIEEPTLPLASEATLSGIDRFVIDKLRDRQLSLAPPATKQQLIRRATFDLTGLPPTWDEVTRFVHDSSPNAFEEVIDRLLESPAYGERWGRHWLDIARYADTHGGAAIGFKRFPFSYTYRDYVIAAFNQDLPYDQFVMEQLAADQLRLPENAPQLAALGFLTVGMQFRNPHNTIDDQIDVVTRGLMGLTVSCARCHDHKFDEISTKDYYSLYATLASSESPSELPVLGTPRTTDELRNYHAELKKRKTSLSDMARDQSEVMKSRLYMQVGLYLREIAKGVPEQDLSNSDIFSYRTDDLRPLVLQRWQDYLRSMSKEDAVFGPWIRLSQFSDSNEFSLRCQQLVEKLVGQNGEPKNDLHRLSATAPRWNPRVLATLKKNTPRSMLEVADAYGHVFAEVHREWLLGLLDTSVEAMPGNDPVPDEDPRHLSVNSPVARQLRRHLYGPKAPPNLSVSQASILLNRPINDNVNGRRGSIHDLNLTSPGSPARAMVLRERAADGPYFVFERGNPIQRGEPVTARFLSALGGSDDLTYSPGERRLSLAKSIVDLSNPLTRRVIVNWVWMHHFGLGLVRTPDDFGTRGERPTHPKLLDYLANRFSDDGWSIKRLHRRIMLSQTYRQASVELPMARRIDPVNRLLWRMPRRRLELEAMRDAMLAASGELQNDGGGRPFELLSNPIAPRRSVYAFVNRDIVSPLLSTFDGANPNACTAKRPDTTVPQQTLFALNSSFIQDRARKLAQIALGSAREKKGPLRMTDVINQLYRRTLSRPPDSEELAAAMTYVNAESKQTNDGTSEAWQRLAHVLLASNEFVFVD